MKELLPPHKFLQQYVNASHLGMCVFCEEDFFKNSPYALAIKYFLDWQKIPDHQDDFDFSVHDQMFLPELYQRTFPIILCHQNNLQKKVTTKIKSIVELIPGLTLTRQQEAIQISQPKVLVVFDSAIDQDLIKQCQSSLVKLTFESSAGHLVTEHPIKLDLVTHTRN